MSTFLGVKDLPPKGQTLAKQFAIISFLQSFIFSLSITFIVLYVIDQIGIGPVGVLSAVMLLTQSVFDYPLGVMSDSIGQRWVISFGWGVLAFIDILLVFATKFSEFLLVYFLAGIVIALFSGAYETWFDNNYRVVVGNKDPDRRIYGFLFGRRVTLWHFGMIIGFIIGGMIATAFSRKILFLFRAMGGIFMIFLIITVMKDQYEKKKTQNLFQNFLKKYLTTTKDGMTFFFSSKKVFFFLFAQMIYLGVWGIWLNFVAFVIYYGYSGSDDVTGIVRTIILIGVAIAGIFVTRISKRIYSTKWISKISPVHFLIFFGGFAILLWGIPLTNQFNLLAIILLVMIIFLSEPFVQLADILIQRVTIDLVPEEIRNSVYSLVPSLAALLSFPFMAIMGFVLEDISFSIGMVILGCLGFASSFCFYLSEKMSS
ncbi:MAG: MFS transporter [Candidatus Hodarchaeales archaeon]